MSWGIFTWAQLASDRWALYVFGSSHDVGLYTALYQIGFYPVSIASTILFQIVSPVLYEIAGTGKNSLKLAHARKLTWFVTNCILATTAGIVAVTAFTHAAILNIFLDERYITISYLLPWILLSSGLFAAGQFISLSLMINLDTKKMIAPKVITALIAIACNFVGAHTYGLNGIVISALIFSSTYLLWMTLLELSTHRGRRVS